MNILTAILAGTGLGALSMYICDPITGRRRRAIARDKMTLLRRKTKEAAGVTARDLRNRAAGLISEGRSLLFEGDISDEVLAERVRSKLGFLVRHPAAIEVQVEDGTLTLRGPVLSDEVDQLIDGVRSVRGVQNVENQLDVHAEPGNVPGLQGDKPKPTGEPMDLLQRSWSPSTRLLVSSAGVLLPFVATRNRKVASSIAFASLILIGYALLEGDSLSSSDSLSEESEGAGTEPMGGWSV